MLLNAWRVTYHISIQLFKGRIQTLRASELGTIKQALLLGACNQVCAYLL
jgi:hypothetical protein